MGQLSDGGVRQALVSAKIQAFSAELVALQTCRDDDQVYQLLMRAIEREPFLLSRIVRGANAAAYSRMGGYAYSAEECFMRLGLTLVKQISEDFLIDQALGRITRANRFARSVWREARVAGRLASLMGEYSGPPFQQSGPFMPTIMSYLAELVLMSLVKAEHEIPSLQIPSASPAGGLDLIEISLRLMDQLQLPEPVGHALNAVGLLGVPAEDDQRQSASAILFSRALAKVAMPVQSFSASVDERVLEIATTNLKIGDAERAQFAAKASEFAREA